MWKIMQSLWANRNDKVHNNSGKEEGQKSKELNDRIRQELERGDIEFPVKERRYFATNYLTLSLEPFQCRHMWLQSIISARKRQVRREEGKGGRHDEEVIRQRRIMHEWLGR